VHPTSNGWWLFSRVTRQHRRKGKKEKKKKKTSKKKGKRGATPLTAGIGYNPLPHAQDNQEKGGEKRREKLNGKGRGREGGVEPAIQPSFLPPPLSFANASRKKKEGKNNMRRGKKRQRRVTYHFDFDLSHCERKGKGGGKKGSAEGKKEEKRGRVSTPPVGAVTYGPLHHHSEGGKKKGGEDKKRKRCGHDQPGLGTCPRGRKNEICRGGTSQASSSFNIGQATLTARKGEKKRGEKGVGRKKKKRGEVQPDVRQCKT